MAERDWFDTVHNFLGRRWCDECESWDHDCGCVPDVRARTANVLSNLIRAEIERLRSEPATEAGEQGEVGAWDQAALDMWEEAVEAYTRRHVGDQYGLIAAGNSMARSLRASPPPSGEPTEAEGEEVRCTCQWAHPVDGGIDASWPADLDATCLVHGPTESREGEEQS